ncbi:MAG: protein-disulfide reductase DsbD domain-containing protein [Candidatus Zixiibacteriota bacterium]
MPKRIRFLTLSLGLAACALLVSAGCGDETARHPVWAELVASTDTARMGEPFEVGVLLKIDPEWHVYWKYSGDAGLPTDIRWTVPDGWSVGELQWPIPTRFVENGPLTTYGYVDSVLLTAEVRPPDNIEPGAAVRLGAQVNWMVCHDECIPGKATLTLDLPMAGVHSLSVQTSTHALRFRALQELLPVASDRAGWSAQAELSPDSTNDKAMIVTLYLSSPEVAAKDVLDWFPSPSPSLLVKRVNRRVEDGVFAVSFSLQSMFGSAGTGEMFESLLVYRDKSGRERGVRVVTPLGVESVPQAAIP